MGPAEPLAKPIRRRMALPVMLSFLRTLALVLGPSPFCLGGAFAAACRWPARGVRREADSTTALF